MALAFTINQRVHMLTRHGDSHEIIAATLNISVAEVVACLTDPARVTAEPYTAAA